ncbi:protein mono-ADP-ribosyltransferase PARP12 isoform X2 [Echeneis naucrates]|uniref:protein mono-ADP-ribosyltransferase PARP12 isoform X2 n=1 Tax=Echeneis naucrates TaxID=173247 RepID=UPI0011141A81|nr:protein mono-ADP-ribosyltransferase PARP12 isoform X2 [Echeneis naucrates]
MTSVISKFVLKALCDHQGFLDFQSLDDTVSQRFTVADSVLRHVLSDDGKIAIRAGRQKPDGGQIMSPDSLLVAKSSLRLCQKKAGECSSCDGLHLCRHLVCGGCTYGQKCQKPHSLDSPHNAEILGRHDLLDLTEKQLFQLLLQNDPFLLPEICPHYNKGNGLHGSCKFEKNCKKLHVCQHNFQGDCKFGTSCKRAHAIDAQGINIFKGFSQENIGNLHELYRNKFIIMGQCAPPVPVLPKVKIPTPQKPSNSGFPPSPSSQSKTLSEVDKNEICLFFIRKHCSFKEKCARVHWHLPYRWQALQSDGVTWKDLPNVEDIEKAYCDPGRDSSCIDQPLSFAGFFSLLRLQSSTPPIEQGIDFMKMTYKGSPVRRLSTVSAVSKPPHFIFTTQWLWYWKDETGQWREFGKTDGDSPASVTSEILENVYLANNDTEIPFSAGKQQYILNFKGGPGTPQMYQENLKYKTKREVRRRPYFVSAHDVKAKVESASSPTSSFSSSSSISDIVPKQWDKSALPDFGYRLCPLSENAVDYKLIEGLFKRTLPRSKINSIQRIQNPSLWKIFHWQKEQMKGRNNGKEVNQLYLFHGTDESLVEAICEQNFDWRMCGVHGTAYGKGSYFARDASYSDRYASIKKTQNKIMFVALVLVGEYTTGRSNYVRPPAKGNSRTLYDSCVDSESNPSIYVVFEKHQIYPEYLIDYS